MGNSMTNPNIHSKYKLYKVPTGGERFYRCAAKQAANIIRCAVLFGKRHGVKLSAKAVDGGVWVFNTGDTK